MSRGIEKTAIAFPVTHILVPQGAEQKAVCRGLVKVSHPPQVHAIPLGIKTWTPEFVQAQVLSQLSPVSGVVLMGLTGGLAPDLSLGTGLLYEGCYDPMGDWASCDLYLTQWLEQRLNNAATVSTAVSVIGVKGLTCDRIIHQAQEKAKLYQSTGLAAVDMEGYGLLKILNAAQIPTAIVRVVSDTSQQSLPDMGSAIGADGTLNPWLLGLTFAQDPLAAVRLIRSSLIGLAQLQELTQQIFQDEAPGNAALDATEI
jgi:hypothetical protein